MRNCAWRTPAELKRYKANCKKERVMKVSLKWLNEYVEVPTDTKALCDKLDLTGTGVEGVEVLGATFDGVVVGLSLIHI